MVDDYQTNSELVAEGSVPAQVENDADPFSPEEAPGVQLIVQMRIYDVLMALLTDANPAMAQKLAEIHRAGNFVGSSPRFTGSFADDEQNL